MVALLSIEDYASAVKPHVIAKANATVFVAGDDKESLMKLRTVLNDSTKVVEQIRMSAKSYKTRGHGYNTKTTRNLLTDMRLLIQANVFIGTATSNLGRFIFYCREESQISLSLDRKYKDFKQFPRL